MSFNPELWVKRNETYLSPSSDVGLLLPASQYIAFGLIYGEPGYGIRDNGGILQYKNSAGVWTDFSSGGGGVTDHGLLSGLADDDHTQYHTDARGDARYFTQAQVTTSLAGKADTSHTHTIANVTGLQTALDAKANTSSLAPVATSGAYADLTGTPDLSVFDEIEQHTNLAAFPATGNAAKFYLAQDTGLLYRWTGSAYAVISAELALGETSTTAYRGDRGATAFAHTSLTNNPHNVTASQVGLGNVNNTSDLAKPISTATQTALDSKANTSHTHTASQITDFATAVAATAAVTANTAKVSNVTHTGEVTGATALTITNDAVTNAKLANVATATIKGRTTAGTGDPEDLTATQATALLDTFTSGAKGLVPASGGGTTNFLRADGTFAPPPGGGGGAVTTVNVAQTGHGLSAGNLIRSNGTNGQYAQADKDVASQADAVGYVTAVADVNNFTYQPLGHYITNNVPAVAAGTAMYVGDSGALTATKPETIGVIQKPVAIVVHNATAMVMFNMRGMEVTAEDVPGAVGITRGQVVALAGSVVLT